MDTSRVSLGELIAAAGALVLLVCMFLPWFDGTLTGGGVRFDTPTKTGWQAFDGVFDLLIVVLAAVPLGVVAGRVANRLPPLPMAQDSLVLAAGALLVALVAFRLIDPPDLTAVPVPGLEPDYSRKAGVFVALIAAGAIAAGGSLQRSVRRVGFEPTSP